MVIQSLVMNGSIDRVLEYARKLIGNRTPAEMAYDDAVILGLTQGLDMQRAIEQANLEHPDEALLARPEHWDEVVVHYDFLRQQQTLLKRLSRSN